VNDKSSIEIARLIKLVCNKGVNGDDARIEARNLKIEARASSVQKRDSIRASTTITGLSPLRWFYRNPRPENIYPVRKPQHLCWGWWKKKASAPY
jgi:hypothetical protein